MLEIRTFRSKKYGVRVDLYRKYRHADPITGKIKFSYKQVGSFLLSKGYQGEALELLQLDEIIQLQNWLAEAKFAEQFEIEADDLEKFTIRMPKKFHDALMRLFVETKRLNINFIPNQVMLESLLHKAKLVQHKLDKINGFNSKIFEDIGIQTEQVIAPQVEQALIDTESRTLFKALLNLNQSIGQTCTELERAASQYGKEKRIPPAQLRDWAADMPNRKPDKRIKKWAYAIAIDVLLQHQLNPLDIAQPEKVAEYWAIQRQEKIPLAEAKDLFLKSFNVPPNLQQIIFEAITRVYKTI